MSKRVAVLMGGWSAEREVSLNSGANCAKALERSGYDVVAIDVQRDVAALLQALEPKPDVVFNALHGRFGEDGTFQGLLDVLQIPYTHSGLLASAVAMDKEIAKRLFVSAGLRCAESVIASRDEVLAGDVIPRPYVVKPVNEGSSVGVKIVLDDGSNEPPFEHASWPYGDTVMVERYVPGRELTVSVMGDKALAVTEIQPAEGFYDYEAKYTDGKAVHVVPADVPDEVTQESMRQAVVAHEVLGCRGVSRADFRYDDSIAGTDGIFILEVNTQPGMTPLSLVPEQAAHVGMSFDELVSWMVEHAQCDG
jgi:D-alanine-D-alanine ligase